MRYVFSTQETKRYRFPTHTNELVMDRSEASASEVFISIMAPGEAPPLHKHDDTEQVFYVLSGRGRLEIGEDGEEYQINPGDVICIPPATLHRVHCLGDEPVRYLVVDCLPGGRPQAEPTWDSHIRVLCQQQGWEYEQVLEN